MFQDTLGVRFPSNMKALYKAVLWRHDFVHRNGRTMNGEDNLLDEHDVRNLVKAVESFVSDVESTRPEVEEDISSEPEHRLLS
jgi:dTDP-glucose pyrophosphorylase